ncbi:hypothetical protein TRFO_34067 [Tritrichomonas foetus]|uniref:E2F/DP family winged-helix DNA-binding domain-containing protein n=1 Tax=Tritrichomonas foetus TaxID=1144522 RepID=A0A1J4JPS4_9EUKA|nr:hypothetical protein TRFO_34067 [Tritrichomonas foetus]|eukprot:OHS99515.1 hypothetical protein TRFO_34067 [Tritrichomonas foetus]
MLTKHLPKDVLPFRTKRKYKNSHSLVSVFQNIVHDYEERHPNDIAIMKVAKTNNIQHRRVYDFFNMLTSLNICQYLIKGKLSWVGLSSLTQTLQESYTKLECESIDIPMDTLFCVGASPSLGTLALKFLCLYIYLGVNTLLLKNVSMLFHDPRADIKSLERRIYLVLNFLEVIGAVSHTSKAGEYKLNLEVSSIIFLAMETKQKIFTNRGMPTLECLLNRLSRSYIDGIQRDRREEFAAITHSNLI